MPARRSSAQTPPVRPVRVRGVPLGPDLDYGAARRAVERLTQSERAFQSQVIAYARLMGWTIWHDAATNTARRCGACGTIRRTPRNAAGLPDLILVRRPRVVWAELKSERGRLTDDQRSWIEELRACGQACYVWRPSDWQEVERVLR